MRQRLIHFHRSHLVHLVFTGVRDLPCFSFLVSFNDVLVPMCSLDMLLQSCSRLAKKEKKGFAWVCHAVVVVTPLQEPQSLVLLVELLQLALLGHNQCVCLQTPLFFFLLDLH